MKPVVPGPNPIYNEAAMRVVFMGTPAFSIPILETLIQEGQEVVGAYCPPEGRRGRRRWSVEASPVKQFALEKGLEVYQPKSLRDPQALEELQRLQPEMIVVAAYGKILPPAVLAIPPLGCLNVHPSLLPRHRGPSPIVTAILQGDRTTGVSIILLDAGMDTGPLLAQREERIRPEDTAASLSERLFRVGAKLLIEAIDLRARGVSQPMPQDPDRASVTHLVAKEDGRVDWGATAETVARMVRAYDPWPGAYTLWKGTRLKLLEVMALGDAPSDELPGTVVRHQASGVAVATGKGLILLRQIQLAGRRPLSAEEFCRGSRDFEGTHLLS